MNQHLPINLAVMGVERRTNSDALSPHADLNTIWLTPYPILTTFRLVCTETGINFLGKPYKGSIDGVQGQIGYKMRDFPGGLTEITQAGHGDGYVLSGYRDEIINGNAGSMHRYAMALDVEVHSVEKQIEVGRAALKQGFTRIGFYPGRKFMHLDMAPDNWIERFGKRRFWVEIDGTKQSFDEIDHAIEFMTGS